MSTSGIIVREDKIRRPGSRRQALLAVFIVVAVAAMLGAAYLVFKPADASFGLKSYDWAVVARKDIVDSVQVAGTIGFSTMTTLAATAAGDVEYIAVSPGDKVAKGQLILRLKSTDAELASLTDSNSLTKRMRDREQIMLSRKSDIDKEQRDLAEARIKVDRATADLAKVQRLLDAGAATRKERDAAEDARRSAESAISDLESRAATSAATYEFNLKNAEADIGQLQEKVANDRDILAGLSVTSPMAGKVIEILVTPGIFVSLRAAVATVIDQTAPVLNLKVSEGQIGKMGVGQAVSILLGTERLPGRISKMDAQATGGSDTTSSTVAVEISFDKPSESLVPGVTAAAEITLGRKEGALVLPRGPFLTTGGQVYVYKIDGDKAVKGEAAFGIVNATEVEVTSGLAEGDKVVVSGYQDFINYDSVVLDLKGGLRK
jgi:HlyD family secretion protein